jgi:phage tail sheath protein FI
MEVMLVNDQTPNVYIKEESNLPPSISQVSTAIPVFIGYTETGFKENSKAIAINTLLEYETLFGKSDSSQFTVTIEQMQVKKVVAIQSSYLLYYAVRHYFENGGGRCYIISVGNYAKTDKRVSKDAILNGLNALDANDELTLIVCPEASKLNAADYGTYITQVFERCKKVENRFTILDVPQTIDNKSGEYVFNENDISDFRKNANSESLKYGAAYYPYLQTTINHFYKESDVDITGNIEISAANANPEVGVKSLEEPKKSAKETTKDANKNNLTLAQAQSTSLVLYHQIKAALDEQRVILPPSAAIAGIYARTDRDKGVWKAPANVPVASVVGPTVRLTDAEQEGLNVDANTGKSINAIRSFTGKGTLVWGARTLDGSSNEWRYVPVRRLFNTIEASAKKASSFAVFEPNVAITWLKVRTMIESYLNNLWRQGALAGGTPEQAFFVEVGLGKTMTVDDINNGFLKVRVGIAAVRPAEFIILTFSHKLQEA